MGGVRAKRANESVAKARNLLIAKSEQADDGGVLQNGRLRVLRRGTGARCVRLVWRHGPREGRGQP